MKTLSIISFLLPSIAFASIPSKVEFHLNIHYYETYEQTGKNKWNSIETLGIADGYYRVWNNDTLTVDEPISADTREEGAPKMSIKLTTLKNELKVERNEENKLLYTARVPARFEDNKITVTSNHVDAFYGFSDGIDKQCASGSDKKVKVKTTNYVCEKVEIQLKCSVYVEINTECIAE